MALKKNGAKAQMRFAVIGAIISGAIVLVSTTLLIVTMASVKGEEQHISLEMAVYCGSIEMGEYKSSLFTLDEEDICASNVQIVVDEAAYCFSTGTRTVLFDHRTDGFSEMLDSETASIDGTAYQKVETTHGTATGLSSFVLDDGTDFLNECPKASVVMVTCDGAGSNGRNITYWKMLD